MELDNLIGFRLKDVMEQLENFNVSKYVFDVTKEPNGESIPITPNFRLLRINRQSDGAVHMLLCADD